MAMGKGMQETSTVLTPQLPGGHGRTEAIPSRRISHRERASHSSTQESTCHSVIHPWAGPIWRGTGPSPAEQSLEQGCGPQGCGFEALLLWSFSWFLGGIND